MNTIQPELMYVDLGIMLQLAEPTPELKTYLSKEPAENISRKVTETLQHLYPQLLTAGIVFVGAGYQVAQILRPNFPIYHELTEVAKIHFRAKQFKSSIVTITAKDERFSVNAFNRDTASFDPLYIFPTLLVLPKNEANQQLVQTMEDNLSQQGIITNVLKSDFDAALDCQVTQMHLVTLSDISSFFATQLIQINLEPLWEVMKHIIFDMGETFQVLGSGHLMYWNGQEVIFIVPTQQVFMSVFSNDESEWQYYRQTLKRLKLLLTDHGIQFAEHVVNDNHFFQSLQTLDSVKKYLV